MYVKTYINVYIYIHTVKSVYKDRSMEKAKTVIIDRWCL